ncbi:MAG TPA: hypothetical protein VGD91_29340 [Trebonia sp.]
MDQPGNNHHLLLRASQSAAPAYNGQPTYNGQPAHNGQSAHNGQAAHNGQPGYTGQPAAERMRDLLARTVHDHIVEERTVATALQEIRLRLDTIDETGPTGTAGTIDGLAATMDGLAATLGAIDGKLTARLERLDERLDDQYDRVRSLDEKLEGQGAGVEETVTKAVAAATADIIARIASLEDTVLTLAEALLRPSIRPPQPPQAAINGRG